MTMFRQHIRHASDETLRGIVAFFNTPDLRRYYLGLVEDAECELQLRAQEDEHGVPEPADPTGSVAVDTVLQEQKRGRRARASER